MLQTELAVKDRKCKECGGVIKQGEPCLVYDSFHRNRESFCLSCVIKSLLSVPESGKMLKSQLKKVEKETNSITCPTCKGKGHFKATWLQCLDCKGNGVVNKKTYTKTRNLVDKFYPRGKHE